MPSESRKKLLENQYQRAIDARDKLNDNYHKWMSYYYLANAGFVVAITGLFKCNPDKGIFGLALVGLFICFLWHLSCKGYYYWLKSWIMIIIRLEKTLTNDNPSLGVYSVFSKEVAEKEDNIFKLTKPSNISTPKLTLIFSGCSTIIWLFYSFYQFYLLFPEFNVCTKISIYLVGVFLLIIALKFLPKLIYSRSNDSHVLL